MSLRPVAPVDNGIIRRRCFFSLALRAYALSAVTSLTARPWVLSNRRQDVERASVWELNLYALMSLHHKVRFTNYSEAPFSRRQ